MSFDEAEGVRGKFRFNTDTQSLEQIDAPKKLEVVAPTVKKDEALDGIHSMLDDKMYYSRSAYERSLKEQGYEITGGDHLGKTKRYNPNQHEKELRETAEKAYYDIKYDRVPIDERSRAINAEEERQWKLYQQRQKTNWAK